MIENQRGVLSTCQSIEHLINKYNWTSQIMIEQLDWKKKLDRNCKKIYLFSVFGTNAIDPASILHYIRSKKDQHIHTSLSIACQGPDVYNQIEFQRKKRKEKICIFKIVSIFVCFL